MRRVRYPKRLKNIRQELEDTWRSMRNITTDPGIREQFASMPRVPVDLIGLRLDHFANQGGILRVADAFRINHVHFEPEEGEKADLAGARGAGYWQPHSYGDVAPAIEKAKAEGKRIYALHLDATARPVQQVEWQFPAVIVFGEEKYGVRKEILPLCDEMIAIPMYGVTTSMNVTQAVTISLHCAMTQFLATNPDFAPARAVSRKLMGFEGGIGEETSS